MLQPKLIAHFTKNWDSKGVTGLSTVFLLHTLWVKFLFEIIIEHMRLSEMVQKDHMGTLSRYPVKLLQHSVLQCRNCWHSRNTTRSSPPALSNPLPFPQQHLAITGLFIISVSLLFQECYISGITCSVTSGIDFFHSA